MMEALYQLYKKNVKPEVREFIEEAEEDETPALKKARQYIESSQQSSD